MAGIRFLASALVCCALVAACRPSDDGNDISPDNGALNDGQAQLPPPPIAPAVLDREKLLLAVTRAASAFALGQDDSEAQRVLDGQQYSFRIRFGCQPAANSAAATPFSVAFDEEERTLRISATPEISIADPAVAAVTTDEVEAAEGFWVERPWLLGVGCPRVPQPAQPASPQADAGDDEVARPATAQAQRQEPSSRIGIAQFFGPDENRTLRRNSRAYQVTKNLAEDVPPSPSGYDIVFSGRLRKMADGRVIACSAASATARPSCIVSASFDRVSIRRGDNDELLAEWGSG